MPNYEVTIKVVITKTYKIEAESAEDAEFQANDNFDMHYESGVDETYTQNTVEVKEVEPCQED